MSERQTQKAQEEYEVIGRPGRPNLPNDPGEHFIYAIEYYVEDGEEKAKLGQKIDWYAYIQASRDSCDITQIVARYLSGDQTVVNVNQPIYGDIAAMPRNINEITDLADKSKAGFDNLSPELKAIFNDSFEDFYNSVLGGTVDTKIKAYAQAKQEAAQKAIDEAAGKEK